MSILNIKYSYKAQVLINIVKLINDNISNSPFIEHPL